MTGPILKTPEPEKTGGATLRIAAIAGGFLVITAGLLLIQPGEEAPTTARPGPQLQVSRAQTGLDLVAPTPDRRPDPTADTTAQDRLGQAVALASAPATAQAPRPAPGGEMQDMTRAILSQLGQPASDTAADAAGNTAQMRDMTAGVLASLQHGSAPQKPSLETLVVQSLRQGQSDAFIDALLNEAAATGQIAVPAALITAEGKLDTATLLASLVRKSGGAAHPELAVPPAGTPSGVTPPSRPRSYVVQSGDSLGAIAHRFYGDAAFYTAIFDANREILTGPNAIRAGQRLNIPAL